MRVVRQHLKKERRRLRSIKQWVQNQRQDVAEVLKALRPGDSIPERTLVQRYNNIHFRLADSDDWKARHDNRKKVVRGKPNRWFERYGAAGTKAVHKAMLNNRRLGADDEVGTDLDGVDRFFGRPEADALREDLG